MSNELTLGLLKQALNNLSDAIIVQNKINNISNITNLLSAKVITLEEALKDKDFRELYDKLHIETCEKPVKQIIKAQRR